MKAQCPPLRVNQVSQILSVVQRTEREREREMHEAISFIHTVITVIYLTVIYYAEAERGL